MPDVPVDLLPRVSEAFCADPYVRRLSLSGLYPQNRARYGLRHDR
jgi:hypothetical protein